MDRDSINALMKREIDLHENGIYIVSDGSFTKLAPLESGTDEIAWEKSSVRNVSRTQKVRLNNL